MMGLGLRITDLRLRIMDLRLRTTDLSLETTNPMHPRTITIPFEH
jgi:hypothetical protein